jgi:hypothetical protein
MSARTLLSCVFLFALRIKMIEVLSADWAIGFLMVCDCSNTIFMPEKVKLIWINKQNLRLKRFVKPVAELNVRLH